MVKATHRDKQYHTLGKTTTGRESLVTLFHLVNSWAMMYTLGPVHTKRKRKRLYDNIDENFPFRFAFGRCE